MPLVAVPSGVPSLQWSLDFIDAWASFGVKGPLRKIWGLKLTQDLTVSVASRA